MAVAVAHYNEKHERNLLRGLNSERFESENLCDATLQVDGKSFSIHKCIVGKVSLFFRKLFKVEMKEKYDSFANMKGLTSEVLESVLTFIYTGSVDINNENVLDLLSASEYLFMDELKSLCRDYLIKHVDECNCLKYFEFGKEREWMLLRRKAEHVIISNFGAVSKQADFISLQKDDFKYLLSRVKQDASAFVVLDVYESVLVWVGHDLNKRKQCLPKLVKLIKFHQLGVDYLKKIVTNSLLKSVPELINSLEEEIQWKLHLHAETVSSRKTFAVVDGKRVSLFEVFSVSWTKLPDLPDDANESCVVAYRGHLYVIGGQPDQRSIRRLKLNDDEPVWEEAGRTLNDRKNASAVVDNGVIIISGGEGTKSVEAYRTIGLEIQQVEIHSMNCEGRYNHSMIKGFGSVYCFGGNVGTLTEKLSHQKWEVLDKQKRFTSCSAVATKNNVYVLSDGKTFDAYNVARNEWKKKRECPIKYRSWSMSYADGKIYVFGSFDVRFRCRHALYEYDVAKGIWNFQLESSADGYNYVIASL